MPAANPSSEEPSLQKIGKFEIVARLGEGAMGTVYRARDPILDREVALKTVAQSMLSKQDTMQRFQREARAAARLQHPNIVTIYELGETEGTLFIAMELLEGMDLAEAMTRPSQLSQTDKVRIVVDICRGLDYAHKRGVIHRDVKPANVRLLSDGTIKIVDFGIARLADSNMTQTGMVLGTPSYIAPEVLLSGRVDHRADMWAVGVVAYEMLAGRRPYESPTIASLVYRIVHEPLAPLDAPTLRIPPALAAVVNRALNKDPSQRFVDLAEMALALETAMGLEASGQVVLTGEVRRRAFQRNFDEAQRLLMENDIEKALEAARRAQALEPSRTDVVSLVEEIEELLHSAPTLPGGPGLTRDDLKLTPLDEGTRSAAAGAAGRTRAASPPPQPPMRTPTPFPTGVPPAPQPWPPAAASVVGSGYTRVPTPVLTDLRVRGAASFRELATFGEPPSTQATLRSPVQDVLATSGADGSIRLWDLHSRTCLQTLRTGMHRRTGHDALALALAFSPDGHLLASGHVDGSVHLWHLDSGEEYAAKLRHEALVTSLAFSPDGTTLASGGMDSNLKLWDVGAAMENEARRALHRQPAGVTALAYAGNGSWLVTGHANRILRMVDARTCRLIATLRGPEALVSLLCLAPDGRRMVVASHDRTVRLFDLESRAQVCSFGGHRKPVSSVSFFADGMHLATVGLDNVVNLWDLESQAALAALWGPKDESFSGVALFGGGDQIAVALSDGRIRVWGPAG